jgi:hypothetical protein
MDPLRPLLPHWQFAEVHHIRSRCVPSALIDAAAEFDPTGDPLIGAAMALREAPARLAARLGLPSALAQRPRFGRADFTPLGRPTPLSVAFGLVGRFWEPGYGLVPFDAGTALADVPAPGAARLLLGFFAEPLADGRSRLTTVTRVHAADAAVRARLALYWAVIRPVSGLIRRRMLARIDAAALAAAPDVTAPG